MKFAHFPTRYQFTSLPMGVRSFAEIVLASSKPLVCGELNYDLEGYSDPGVSFTVRDDEGVWSLDLFILEGQAYVAGTFTEKTGFSGVSFAIHVE